MFPKEENITKTDAGLNASPYTIASLIGATELGKMGIVFPDFVAGINQNMNRHDTNNSEALTRLITAEKVISDSQSFTQNTQILKIQEPICIGKYI